MSGDPFLRSCSDCGASLQPDQPKCWLCGRATPTQKQPAEENQSTQGAAPPAQLTFGLSSLMLVMTLVAVCLGVIAAAPGLGVLLAVVATPALVRTWIASARQKARGTRLGPGEKLLAFAGSLGMIVLVGASAGIAFYATCWIACGAAAAVGVKDASFGFGIVVGIVVGLIVAVLMLRWLWPLRPRKPSGATAPAPTKDPQ